jgi:biofilm protein TabA
MNSFSSQAGKPWTKKSAAQWVAQGEWCNGLKDVKPYKGTDMVEFATQYHQQKDRWDKVFQWMATHDVATLAPGKYDIDGTHAFANVQDAVLRSADEVRIESHKKYIDLQWTVVGIERYGIVKPKYATIQIPYKGDVMFWNTTKISYVNSKPDMFFLFFPNNYHRPCVLPKGGVKNVRKVCIKIEYDESI